MSVRPRAIADLKASELRSQLGLSPSYTSELLNRKRTPSLEIAVRIEKAFGVPASAWLSADDESPRAGPV